MARGADDYFHESGRAFPWRAETNVYRLAVAEILLQKTRASVVAGAFLTLLERYPDAEVLSDASVDELEEVLRPLGLSRKRAEQLIGMGRAARAIGGVVFENWRTLLADVPGLGAYAARAIACFGRGEAVGIVDANTARILRRVFRIRSEDSRAVVYQQHADQIALAAADPRATNFGLLDLGAVVCLPKPLCERCPFSDFCPRYGVPRPRERSARRRRRLRERPGPAPSRPT